LVGQLSTAAESGGLRAVLADPPDVGGTPLGGLSGLAALDRAGNAFLTVTDRGPNRDMKDRGAKASAFLDPTYVPSVVRLERATDRLRVTDRMPLRFGPGGNQVTGLPMPGRDVPAYDETGRRELSPDPNGVDPEGIALDPRDGSFWIAEEYGPSILHVDPRGTITARLMPAGLAWNGSGVDVHNVLPEVLMRRKANRGFEGIAISPDGRALFAIMQTPLANPSEHEGEASRNIRIVALDISGAPRVNGVYIYQSEPAERVGVPQQDDVRVGDLAALSATRLLVAERDSGPSSHYRMIYAVDLSTATDVSGHGSQGRTLEQMGDADLARAGIVPVVKQPVSDLCALGFNHERIEGLAIVDERTLAVANDNDFDPNEPSELFLINLPAPLGR
jgi:hypothetical protein